MKCREIQDILITDYLDGELDKETQERVDNHLLACDACSRFYSTVKKATAHPLKNAFEDKPDESVWLKIKGQIEEDRAVQYDTDDNLGILDRLAAVFSPGQAFAMAVASVVVFLVVSIFTVNHYGQVARTGRQPVSTSTVQYAENTQAAEEMIEDGFEYLAYLDEDPGDEYMTGMEEYFL